MDDSLNSPIKGTNELHEENLLHTMHVKFGNAPDSHKQNPFSAAKEKVSIKTIVDEIEKVAQGFIKEVTSHNQHKPQIIEGPALNPFLNHSLISAETLPDILPQPDLKGAEALFKKPSPQHEKGSTSPTPDHSSKVENLPDMMPEKQKFLESGALKKLMDPAHAKTPPQEAVDKAVVTIENPFNLVKLLTPSDDVPKSTTVKR